MRKARFTTRRAMFVAGIAMAAALLPATVGSSALGALIGLQSDEPTNTTTATLSTRTVVVTERVDLDDAEATECGTEAQPPVLVDQTSVTPEDPVSIETTTTIGAIPDGTVIYVGENQQTPFLVVGGGVNIDTLLTYQTTITQFFQGVAEGAPCVVAAAARFAG